MRKLLLIAISLLNTGCAVEEIMLRLLLTPHPCPSRVNPNLPPGNCEEG